MNDKKYSLRPYLLAYKWHYAIGIFVLLAVDLANPVSYTHLLDTVHLELIL